MDFEEIKFSTFDPVNRSHRISHWFHLGECHLERKLIWILAASIFILVWAETVAAGQFSCWRTKNGIFRKWQAIFPSREDLKRKRYMHDHRDMQYVNGQWSDDMQTQLNTLNYYYGRFKMNSKRKHAGYCVWLMNTWAHHGVANKKWFLLQVCVVFAFEYCRSAMHVRMHEM